MTQPLDLDQIEVKTAELRARLDRKNPWPCDSEAYWQSAGWRTGTRNVLDKLHPEAMAAEIRRLRDRVAELERPAVEKQRNEIRQSFTALSAQASQDGDHEGAFSLDCQLREREEQWKTEDAAVEAHVVADDTIWVERRPCGCIVSAVVAIVPGEWTLTTAQDVALHFHPTEGERRRAAEAGLTVEPVTGAQYRELRNRWHCNRHAAAVPAARP